MSIARIEVTLPAMVVASVEIRQGPVGPPGVGAYTFTLTDDEAALKVVETSTETLLGYVPLLGAWPGEEAV